MSSFSCVIICCATWAPFMFFSFLIFIYLLYFCLIRDLDVKSSINRKTIIQAINMVVDAISDYGFVVGNINLSNGNDIIGSYSTLNKTVTIPNIK